MTVIYFYKDYLKIYWRVEFFSNSIGPDKVWDVGFYRSLSSFADDLQEVFTLSIACTGETPDLQKALLEFSRYYQSIFLGMAQHLQALYTPEIKYAQPEHHF